METRARRTWVRNGAVGGALGVAALLLVQACTSESVTAVDIGSVRVTPSSSTVIEGLTVQFEATVYDRSGAPLPGASVTWSSDRPDVASVNDEGMATALSTGKTTIRASFNGTAAEASLTVEPAPTIGVDPGSVTFYGGALGPAPEATTLSLTNEGGGNVGTLSVHIAYPEGAPSGWLTAELADEEAPTDLTLSAVSADLPAGSYEATVTVTPSDPSADDVPATIPVTLSLAAFTVTESGGGTQVAEYGSSDSLTTVLDVAPASNVTLIVTSGDAGEVEVSPASLTFTPANWDTPQTVTLTAVDDFEADGDQTTVVTLSVDADGSDEAYAPALDRTVDVTIVDGDAAGFVVTETDGGTAVTEAGGEDLLNVVLRTRPESNVVITATGSDPGEAEVSPTTLTFRPADWDVPKTITVTGVDDDLVDGRQTSTVALRVDEDRSDESYHGLADQSVTVTTLDDDGAGLVVSESQGSTVVTEGGSVDAFTVVLTAQPTGDVVVRVTSADVGEATVSPSTLTFTPADWSTPQPVSVRGVDDGVTDGDIVTIITVSVDAGASAPEYGSVPAATVEVTTLDDDLLEGNFVVTESGGGTVVAESGTTDGFTVVLTVQPTSNVVLGVTSGDPSEAVVSHSSLTFTPSNWHQPRTVTVTGVDDGVVDGDQETTVTVAVNAGASDDAFDNAAAQTVIVTTTDDDVAGFTLADTADLTVTEGGGTDAFTVVLDAEPVSDVVLTVKSGNPGAVTASPTEMTFTPANWSFPRTVTLTGVNDDVVGDRETEITVAVDDARSHAAFDGLSAVARVTTLDDDEPGGAALMVSPESLSVPEDESAVFTVRLASPPTLDVVLDVFSLDEDEVTVSPSMLTFTSGNWDVRQEVTVTADDDDETTQVVIAVDPSMSDPAYASVPDAEVTVTTTDDDDDGLLVLASG